MFLICPVGDLGFSTRDLFNFLITGLFYFEQRMLASA